MFDKYDKFTVSKEFYNGYPLLSKTDSSGSKPALYFAVSNRSAGKTTFFNGNCLHQFLKKRKKFLLLYRYKYQYQAAADGFFKNIGVLYYQGLEMEQEIGVKGVFDRLYITDGEQKVECGSIVLGFLKNILAQIESGVPVTIAVPAWLREDGEYERIDILDDINDMGYNVNNKSREGLLYHRDNQVVARDIIILRKK